MSTITIQSLQHMCLSLAETIRGASKNPQRFTPTQAQHMNDAVVSLGKAAMELQAAKDVAYAPDPLKAIRLQLGL